MRIYVLRFNGVTECECCGAVLIKKYGTDIEKVGRSHGDVMDDLSELYHKHEGKNPKCQKYHDELPNFHDMVGILKD